MDLGLNGRSVLITGASKGIGRATAEAFAREGAGDIHITASARAGYLSGCVATLDGGITSRRSVVRGTRGGGLRHRARWALTRRWIRGGRPAPRCRGRGGRVRSRTSRR